MDSERELDELLGALSGSSSARSSVTVGRPKSRLVGDDTYDFLDNFLAEMGGSEPPSTISSRGSSIQGSAVHSPSAFISELDDILAEENDLPMMPEGFSEWATVPEPEGFSDWAAVAPPEDSEDNEFSDWSEVSVPDLVRETPDISLDTDFELDEIMSESPSYPFASPASIQRMSEPPKQVQQPPVQQASARKTNAGIRKAPIIGQGLPVVQQHPQQQASQGSNINPKPAGSQGTLKKPENQTTANFAALAAQMATNRNQNSPAQTPTARNSQTPTQRQTNGGRGRGAQPVVQQQQQQQQQPTQRQSLGGGRGGSQQPTQQQQFPPTQRKSAQVGPQQPRRPLIGSELPSRNSIPQSAYVPRERAPTDSSLHEELDSLIGEMTQEHPPPPMQTPTKAPSLELEIDELSFVLGVDPTLPPPASVSKPVVPLQPSPMTQGFGGGLAGNEYVSPQMKFYQSNVAAGITSFLVADRKPTMNSLPPLQPLPPLSSTPSSTSTPPSSDSNQLKRVNSEQLDDILAGIDPTVDERRRTRRETEILIKQQETQGFNDLLSGLDSEYLASGSAHDKAKKEKEEAERKKREELEKIKLNFVDFDELEQLLHEDVPLKFWPDDDPKSDNNAPRTRTEQLLEDRFNQLIDASGTNITMLPSNASGKHQLEINQISVALKRNVEEAKSAASSPDVGKPIQDYVINSAKDAVNRTAPFINTVKILNEEIAKAGPYGIDKGLCYKLVDELRVKRAQMLKSHRECLQAILSLKRREEKIKMGAIVPNSGSPSSDYVIHPADVGAGPWFGNTQIDVVEEAKNAILSAFRDFYIVEQPPKPNTLEALNYIPWKPERTLLQYTQASIQDFKPIIDMVNGPFPAFNFSTFGGMITAQLGLLVPVVKVIRLDVTRYRKFVHFPNDVKMWVNTVLKFNSAVQIVQRKGNIGPQDVDLLRAQNAQQELIKALRGVLNTLREIIVFENTGS